jgi:hypothetical protein
MSKQLQLILLGAMGRVPFAGMAWEVLHYVEGFRRLGHDVYYIEDTNTWPYDPEQDGSSEDCRHAVEYIARAMDWAGLGDRWAYRAAEPDGRIYGLSESCFSRLFEQADVLINHGASTRLREEHLGVPVRVLLQTDPGGEEILVAEGDPATIEMLRAHTHFANWAENFGSPDCVLPVGPFLYRATRMPLVLDWATPPGGLSFRPSCLSQLRFTTIGNWQQPGENEWKGEVYAWSKHHQFLKFIDLPRRLGQTVELALGSVDSDSIELLVGHGWRVIDAYPFGKDMMPFQDYILRSDGEFTVAKDQYVRMRTGWFSDRSAYYLAAGKPVITQDTGFGKFLPTGEGLFSFNTMDDIVAAFEAIRSDYARHSRAARAVAEEYFRAETVLAKLIDDLDLQP